MPHLRSRFALNPLKKKLKFSRVVSVQGARQTGKSVLARDLFKNGYYVTFDRANERIEAEGRIGVYLHELQESASKKTIVIDEAQKVPILFDQIKSIVDEDPHPGQFLLLGSTEFSIESKIKESLTGRISRTRLFPLLLTETLASRGQRTIEQLLNSKTPNCSRPAFLKYLSNGGFPAIFAIRDESERLARIEEWLKLTCERDVLQVKKLKPNSELCQRILEILPHLEVPSANEIGNKLKKNSRSIETQLKALSLIFAIHRLDPHPLSTGKSLYYLIDSSLAHFSKGTLKSMMDVAFYTEFLAKQSYQNIPGLRFSYYRGPKGGRVSLLAETSPKEILAIKWLDTETIDRRELAILNSFKSKASAHGIKTNSLLLAGLNRPTTVDGVRVLPWEFIF
jgi:predicted AAA+ superfamily ATPase